jgi:hypothetical protein
LPPWSHCCLWIPWLLENHQYIPWRDSNPGKIRN